MALITRILPILKEVPPGVVWKLKHPFWFLTHDWRPIRPEWFHPFAANFEGCPPERAEREFAELDADSRRAAADYLARCEVIRKLCSLPLEPECFLCDYTRLRGRILRTPAVTFAVRRARRRWGFADGGADALLYQQGVALLPDAVKCYLNRGEGTVFIDAGAHVGHGTLPLLQYGPKRIYAFEPSAISGGKLLHHLKRNRIPEETVEWVRAGLSSRCGEVSFADGGGAGQRLDGEAGGERVPVTTLDAFASGFTVPVGLLKTDVEGMNVELLRGAPETLRRDRPVLALSIYHTPEEFFGSYALLRRTLTDYRYRIVDLPPGSCYEITLLGWPREAEDGRFSV